MTPRINKPMCVFIFHYLTLFPSHTSPLFAAICSSTVCVFYNKDKMQYGMFSSRCILAENIILLEVSSSSHDSYCC